MSEAVSFFPCDLCLEEWGRLEPARWRVNGDLMVCEIHANRYDETHELRIAAIIKDFVRRVSQPPTDPPPYLPLRP